MGDHLQWVTVDEVVAAYMSRSEQSVHRQFKITHIAFDGMKQLGLDFFYTVKSIKILVNANLTANLPPDYLNYTKVGVFNDRSEVIPLPYNDKLTFFDDLSNNRAQNTEDNTLGINGVGGCWNFYNYCDNGNFIGTIYGVPSGAPFIGSFKIDNANQIVVLNENFTYPYIVLEYIASPEPEQGTYYLPFQFKEALIAYIGWQDLQYLPITRRGSVGDKQQRKKNYMDERRVAIARYKPIRLEEYYEEQMGAQRLTVKI